MTHPNPTCETCRWWRQNFGGSRQGQCRRHAPRPSMYSDSWDWPTTDGEHWCGEHLPRIPLPMAPPLFDPVLDKEIWYVSDKVHVSLRLSNALEAVGIRTIRQVISKSHREIESVRNLGKTSMAELQKMLADLGVVWPENGTKGEPS